MGKTRLLSFTSLGLFLLGCVDPSRIELPEPTGERASDHAAVAEAFERVEPGGTIAFAAGTYLVGSEGLVLRTPWAGVRSDGYLSGAGDPVVLRTAGDHAMSRTSPWFSAHLHSTGGRPAVNIDFPLSPYMEPYS